MKFATVLVLGHVHQNDLVATTVDTDEIGSSDGCEGSVDVDSFEHLCSDHIDLVDLVTIRAHPSLALLGSGLVEMRSVHARLTAVLTSISFSASIT